MTPSGWRPGLVALDIDGTLVDHTDQISDQVVAGVEKVVACGVPVVLTTGRSWLATRGVFDALGLPPGPAVASNGAVTVRYPPFEITEIVTFDPTDVIASVSAEHPRAALAVEVVGQGYRVTRHFPDGDLHGQIEVVDLTELAAGDVTRIVVRDPEASDADFTALAKRLGLTGLSYFVGWSAWLDIAPGGVNKATALARVADELDVAQSQVLAIGDGRNDIEMLAWAGRGVAMGDSNSEVTSVADHVTGTFAEDGLVTELRRWFG